VYPIQTTQTYNTRFLASPGATVPPGAVVVLGLNLNGTPWNADGITYTPTGVYGTSADNYVYTNKITFSQIAAGKTFITIPATWCEPVIPPPAPGNPGPSPGQHYVCNPNKAIFTLEDGVVVSSLTYDPDNVNILENDIVYEITNSPSLVQNNTYTLTVTLAEDPLALC